MPPKRNELTEYFSEHLKIWKSGYLLASEWPLETWGTCWEHSGNLMGVQIENNKHPTPHPPPKDKTSLWAPWVHAASPHWLFLPTCVLCHSWPWLMVVAWTMRVHIQVTYLGVLIHAGFYLWGGGGAPTVSFARSNLFDPSPIFLEHGGTPPT
jgi:hypothetical protein